MNNDFHLLETNSTLSKSSTKMTDCYHTLDTFSSKMDVINVIEIKGTLMPQAFCLFNDYIEHVNPIWQ